MELFPREPVLTTVRMNLIAGSQLSTASRNEHPVTLCTRLRHQKPLALEPDPRLHQRLQQSVLMLPRILSNRVWETKIVPAYASLCRGRKRVKVLHEDACKLLGLKLEQSFRVGN